MKTIDKSIIVFMAVSITACSGPLSAENTVTKCLSSAASHYRIALTLLHAIARVESNYDIHAVNTGNRNGTADYGIMQINSSWFPTLKKMGISRKTVIQDPCMNIHVGAWILATNFHTHGYSWNSVGAYNAGFSNSSGKIKARRRYIKKIKTAITTLREGNDNGRQIARAH